MAKNRKHRGLHRPKRLINFQISSTESDDTSIQSTAFDGLRKQILLLDLMIRRNKNQHRSQVFFRDTQMLRNALKRLLAIHDQLETLSVSQKIKSAEEARRKFEQEATLRGHKEVIVEHVRDVLIPKCYVAFSTVVADIRFANLGVVLMGLLAEIALGKNGVGAPVQMTEMNKSCLESTTGQSDQVRHRRVSSDMDGFSIVGLSTKMTGEDHGEVIERKYEHVNTRYQDQPELESPNISAGMKSNLNIDINAAGNSEYKNFRTSDLVAKPIQLNSHEAKRDKSVVKEKRIKKKKNTLDDLFSNLI